LSGPAFLNSAALPNEKARRSLEVLLFALPPPSLMADNCLTAGLSTREGEAGFSGDVGEGSAVSPDWLFATSLSIDTGFERGDELVVRVVLAASEDELLGGMLTNRG
jgi:hypothetical protein